MKLRPTSIGGLPRDVSKHTLYQNNMGNLLYTIAVILVIIWAIGFFGFAVGSLIHLLLVIAVIAILFRVIRGNNTV